MVKTLYVIGIVALICAGLLFGLSGVQLLQGVPPDEQDLGICMSERLLSLQSLSKSNRQSLSPLLEQATAYALYLTPPKPPSPPGAATPQPIVSAPPVPRPPTAAPQFRLLAISYYRSSPDRSLAMVWDGSKGGYWIKKGDRLGHFVVERIEKEAIFYRDGDQLRQMAVAIKEPVQLGRLKSKESASNRQVAANETLVIASQ